MTAPAEISDRAQNRAGLRCLFSGELSKWEASLVFMPQAMVISDQSLNPGPPPDAAAEVLLLGSSVVNGFENLRRASVLNRIRLALSALFPGWTPE